MELFAVRDGGEGTVRGAAGGEQQLARGDTKEAKRGGRGRRDRRG